MVIEETREKIVNAATELFMHEGCKRVTMDQIASHMHISKRTLYESFLNKEELLEACMDKVYAIINTNRQRLTSQVEEPMLLALFLMRNAVDINHRYGTFLNDIERYYPEIHRRYLEVHSNCFRAGVMNSLLEAQQRNLLRPNINLVEISETMTKIMRMLPKDDIVDRESHIKHINELGFTFIRGLMTTEAICQYDEQEETFREIINKQSPLMENDPATESL